MNRRIRKKKGLLKDRHYNQMKKELFQAMEEKAGILEQQAAVQSAANKSGDVGSIDMS